jgi:hypothetical protein
MQCVLERACFSALCFGWLPACLPLSVQRPAHFCSRSPLFVADPPILPAYPAHPACRSDDVDG